MNLRNYVGLPNRDFGLLMVSTKTLEQNLGFGDRSFSEEGVAARAIRLLRDTSLTEWVTGIFRES